MVNGKRVVRSTKQTDYKLAEEVASTWDAELNRDGVDAVIGKQKKAAAPTFAAYANDYLATVSTQKPHKLSVRLDTVGLRPAIEFFGDTVITAIDGRTCERFLVHLRTTKNMRGKKNANNTIVKHTIFASMVFNRAIAEKIATSNPMRDIHKTLRPMWQTKDRIITLDEQRQIDDALGDTEMRRIFRVLIGTGLRREELLMLDTKRHVDMANYVLRLSKDIVKGKKKARAIPMSDGVVEALVAQLAVPREDTTVFKMRPTAINTGLTRAAAAAKLASFTPHDCRRTFMTRCAESGVPMHVLQQWVGHSNITMTAKFYIRGNEESSIRYRGQVNDGIPASVVVPFQKKEGTHRND